MIRCKHKRNNFANVGLIIVDEFISEKLDKTTLDNPRRISSIIQSVLRLEKVRIYLLGNSVRLDDPILARMGFKLEKYGIYKKWLDLYKTISKKEYQK